MDKPKSSLYFKITVAAFKLRDWLSAKGKKTYTFIKT